MQKLLSIVTASLMSFVGINIPDHFIDTLTNNVHNISTSDFTDNSFINLTIKILISLFSGIVSTLFYNYFHNKIKRNRNKRRIPKSKF